MLNKEIIILREKVKSILKNMLPFNELDFKIHFDKDYKQLKYIDLYITGSNAYLLSGELATFLSGRYV